MKQTVWYNPIMNELGILYGQIFIMENSQFNLYNWEAQRLAGAKWVKIGDFV